MNPKPRITKEMLRVLREQLAGGPPTHWPLTAKQMKRLPPAIAEQLRNGAAIPGEDILGHLYALPVPARVALPAGKMLFVARQFSGKAAG